METVINEVRVDTPDLARMHHAHTPTLRLERKGALNNR